MPQPLSKVNPNAGVILGQDPFATRPELALHVMRVITIWTFLEATLSSLFINMLGSNPRPGAAIYDELTSTATQQAALRAVASVALSEEENDFFEALLSLFKTAAKERNKIVHWIWGHSPDVADGVILCDPELLREYHIALGEFIRGPEGELPDLPQLPKEEVFVFYQRDFEDTADRIKRLILLFMIFEKGIGQRLNAKRFDALLNVPEIRAFLDRRRKDQKTAPVTPSQ